MAATWRRTADHEAGAADDLSARKLAGMDTGTRAVRLAPHGGAPRAGAIMSNHLKGASRETVGPIAAGVRALSASEPSLRRTTFRTSRLAEFCSEKELVNQTGHEVEQWPLVVLKELIDNSLDACEEAGIPPVISVSVADGEIVIADNGPGIPPETVEGILDYTARVSSREAYVSPTRGAQGNALKTILAMAFALDGAGSETAIEAHGVAHRVTFSIDRIRREPKITHIREASPVRIGTRIIVDCSPYRPDRSRPAGASSEAVATTALRDPRFQLINPPARSRR